MEITGAWSSREKFSGIGWTSSRPWKLFKEDMEGVLTS